MNNSIKASLNFYFKGEKFEPHVDINLDDFFTGNHDVDFIYDMLAKSIGIDKYRHEYDVMVLEDVCYGEPQGIAVDYVQDGEVDWQGLKLAWQDTKDMDTLTPIANKFFNVENLQDDPKLAAALLAAYRLGQQTPATAVNTSLNEGFYG